ncbi:MAG TPA: glycosyltransferase [Steroidobacteraceae bacterium]|nr:glycosyltransferase [Steroidobacteraceae bacterium]
MNICIVGKYLPIEGGVSTQTYWLARGLAHRGHNVHVVSNSNEVEAAYRVELRPQDSKWAQPRFRRGGAVHLYGPQAYSRRAMGHIPRSNPFVTKLASVATDVIRSGSCDVILSYYLEPYALSGYLASLWTGRPLVVKHAGSDLDRLFMVPDCATAYSEVLRAARFIATQRPLVTRFLRLGIQPDKIRTDLGSALPLSVFSPRALPLRFDGRDQALPKHAPDGEYDSSLPSIGIYGKIGDVKGTFDLIQALGLLKAEGLRFNLMAMVGKCAGQTLATHLTRANLRDNTHVLPFLPNWLVPRFIRSCTAVCFLERHFPVAVHGPIVPQEVLASGTCLVVSEEIARKQSYERNLVHGSNVLIVKDPRDVSELASTLRQVIREPQLAARIGLCGSQLRRHFGSYDEYIRRWEKLLLATRVGNRRAVARASAKFESIADLLEQPFVSTLVANFPTVPSAESTLQKRKCPVESALAWVAAATRELHKHPRSRTRALMIEALRYQSARLRIGMPAYPSSDAPFVGPDGLLDGPIDWQTIAELYPCANSRSFIETFRYDVTRLFCDSVLQPRQHPQDACNLGGIARRTTFVLFARMPNMHTAEFRISAATVKLLSFCTGARTTMEVMAKVRASSRREDRSRDEPPNELVCDTLSELYRLKLLVFLRRNNPWGLLGGARPLASTLKMSSKSC